MTRRDDFGRAVRSGRRAGRPTVVAHLLARPESHEPARVGLVVSRTVGNAVVRNRVSRRLRHQMRSRLTRLAPGSLLVLRAQPLAATAASDCLGEDLDRALARVLAPVDA
jgi:ribonuclease P protein component